MINIWIIVTETQRKTDLFWHFPLVMGLLFKVSNKIFWSSSTFIGLPFFLPPARITSHQSLNAVIIYFPHCADPVWECTSVLVLPLQHCLLHSTLTTHCLQI